MEIKCDNCQELKTEHDFRYTKVKNTIYFNVKKCKKCFSEGKNKYNKKVLPLDITGLVVKLYGYSKEIRKDLNRDIYLLLKRIELNKGNVDDLDCFKLVSLYTEAYGEIYTKLDREYEMLYYYEKLKEYNGKANV
jgi:hypothetical protein